MLNFNKKDVMMMRYSIVKKQDKNTHEVAETIKRALTANAWEYDEDDPELVICVGETAHCCMAFISIWIL